MPPVPFCKEEASRKSAQARGITNAHTAPPIFRSRLLCCKFFVNSGKSAASPLFMRLAGRQKFQIFGCLTVKGRARAAMGSRAVTRIPGPFALAWGRRNRGSVATGEPSAKIRRWAAGNDRGPGLSDGRRRIGRCALHGGWRWMVQIG